MSAPVVEHVETPDLDDLYLVLVTQGSKLVESWDGTRWHTALHVPGRFFMAASNSPAVLRWRATSADPIHLTHVYLPGGAVQEAVEAVGGVDGSDARLPQALVADDPVIDRVSRALVDAARTGVDDFYAQHALAYLTAHLAQRHVGASVVPAQRLTITRTRQACDYMTERLGQRVTLAEVAAHVNLSQYHFLRLFRDATGEAPFRYLTRIRVETAARLLEHSGSSIDEIAAQCGFSSSGHLSIAFRRRTGLSPRDYRRSS